VNLEVYFETVLAALGDGNRVSLEMHLEAVIERTWRQCSCELRDALRGRDHANLKVLLGQLIVREARQELRLFIG
jgi:hypothetical protein